MHGLGDGYLRSGPFLPRLLSRTVWHSHLSFFWLWLLYWLSHLVTAHNLCKTIAGSDCAAFLATDLDFLLRMENAHARRIQVYKKRGVTCDAPQLAAVPTLPSNTMCRFLGSTEASEFQLQLSILPSGAIACSAMFVPTSGFQ